MRADERPNQYSEAPPDRVMCFMMGLCKSTNQQGLADMCLLELMAFLTMADATGMKRHQALA